MATKRYVLYIGNFSFPDGNAAGKRVYSNGKILRELGFIPVFIGMDKNIDSDTPLEGTHNSHDGFTYYNFQYPQTTLAWGNFVSRYKELIYFLESKGIIKDLEVVILYGSISLSFFNRMLIRYCNRKGIKIVADCVDWLTVKTKNNLFNLVKWIDNTYQKAIVNRKSDGIIVIGNYLNSYYKEQKIKTVIIPPLTSEDTHTPLEATISNRPESEGIQLVYAGIPFRLGTTIKNVQTLKDRIDLIILTLWKLKKENIRFTLNIFGFTREDYIKAIPDHTQIVDELSDRIIFNGYVPNVEILKRIRSSDFTILFRDNNRASNAGFPTKISESIGCGTPVITNRTSDIEEYICDGENGFIVDLDSEDYYKKLLDILQLSKSEIYRMKRNCYENNVFFYKRYQERLGKFIESL